MLGLLILLARAVPSGILLLFTLLARVLGRLDSIVSRKGRALEAKARSAFILSLPRFLEVKYSSAPLCAKPWKTTNSTRSAPYALVCQARAKGRSQPFNTTNKEDSTSSRTTRKVSLSSLSCWLSAQT